VLPHLPKHAGDRNRTSPFAFTGNKFEFRALGSSQSISWPATVLNTIVAEAIDDMCVALETELAKGTSFEDALRQLLAREIRTVKRIIFNGDGYSEAWQKEAAERGLLNHRTTLDALEPLCDDRNVALFEKYGVLSRRELESRHEIMLDQYFKTVNIEGETTAEIARTMILPAAVRYLNELLDTTERAKSASVSSAGAAAIAREVSALIDELVAALGTLVERNADLGGDTVHEKAYHMRDKIIPAMNAVRQVVDKLERVLPDHAWPLPKYRDMLFVK
jgi:glutamine synthetase